jgi:IclR family pca regulon transcriptional regulator
VRPTGAATRRLPITGATVARRTPKTIIDRGALAKAVRKARADGFAIIDEELELGLRLIAVPILDRLGMTVAAVNVSTQSARFSVAEMERAFLPVLLGARERIEDFFD